MSATSVLLIFTMLIALIVAAVVTVGTIFLMKYGWMFIVANLARIIIGTSEEKKPKKSTKRKRS